MRLFPHRLRAHLAFDVAEVCELKVDGDRHRRSPMAVEGCAVLVAAGPPFARSRAAAEARPSEP